MQCFVPATLWRLSILCFWGRKLFFIVLFLKDIFFQVLSAHYHHCFIFFLIFPSITDACRSLNRDRSKCITHPQTYNYSTKGLGSALLLIFSSFVQPDFNFFNGGFHLICSFNKNWTRDLAPTKILMLKHWLTNKWRSKWHKWFIHSYSLKYFLPIKHEKSVCFSGKGCRMERRTPYLMDCLLS